jgi:hypothetical protein
MPADQVRRRLAPVLLGAGLAGLLAGLLAAAWLVPWLSVAVVWPLLFVVPGWAIMAATRPRIAATGRAGLAVVLSVAISAHLVYWLSIVAGGYTRPVVFAAAAVLAAPIPIAAWRRGPASLSGELASALRSARRNLLPFGFAGLTVAFVALVLDSGLWAATETGVAAGGSNWSDLGVHLSIAQSLNAGNFPPEVPYFAGAPLVYHWFADFHAAIAANAAGIFAVPAFVSSSAILAGALALLVHGLALSLVRGRRARRVALLAAVLVVFGGGFGWVRLVSDVAGGYGDPISLVTANSYDNSWFDVNHQVTWPYFRIPSVMGTGLLVHRATTAGLPIMVGAVLLLVAGLPSARRIATGWRDRPALIALAGLLGALLAPFHFFFFPAFWLLALAWVLAGGRVADRAAPRNAVLLLAPLLLAVPFALPPILQAGGSGALALVPGWESAPWADGIGAVAFFYATNLGLPFLLALLAIAVSPRSWRLFLGLWMLALFVVPNVVQVSVVAFDMNKYFQAMWIAVAILAAWLIRRWPWPAVAAVVLLSIPSPLLVAGWTAWNREQVLDWRQVAAAEWIAANTPGDAVFATDGWLNSPTDPAGRLRLLTYTPYVANLGFDPGRRAQQLQDMYCTGDPADTTRLMRELGAGYLLDIGRPTGCTAPTDFATSPALRLVYDRDGVRIWQLADDAARTGSTR